MKMLEALDLLISDLQQLRAALLKESREAQEIAVLYLLGNAGLIRHCLEVAYTEHTKDERAALQNVHSELDYSGISDSFQKTATQSILQASNYWITSDKKHMITDDEVHMTKRAMQYAKYFLGNPNRDISLLMHPVGKYLHSALTKESEK